MMIEPIHIVIAGGVLTFVIIFILAMFGRLRPIFTYAYINTRLNAMEARFFSKMRINDISQQKSVKDAYEMLDGTDYNKICESEQKDHEVAFNQYLVDNILEIQKFSPKTIFPILKYYLREWETANVLYALAIVMNKITVDEGEIRRNCVEVPLFGYEKIKDLIYSKDIDEVARKLKDTEYYQIINEYINRHNDETNAGVLNAMLDKHNIIQLYEDSRLPLDAGKLNRILSGKNAERRSGHRSMNAVDSSIIKSYLGIKADISNIITTLRICSLKGNIDDDIKEQFIPIGRFINLKKREELLLIDKIENIGRIVSGTPYEERFKNGLNEYLKTGKIDGIVRRLDEYLLSEVRQAAVNYPFSIAGTLRYMTLKRNEVLLLRGIFKGIKDNVSFEIDEDMNVVDEE